MKIHPSNQIFQPYKQSAEQLKQAQKPREAKQDQVEISQTAKEMQTGHIDDARKAKLDALQKDIDAGQYRVDEREVAHRFYQYWSE
ncbi:flagellar biosynthesis anti-sigma factor FlgM [Natribacillus halophilus]|uniref:Negative regulator of flagellin synthesis n=1 Tax=Natribacillus halophilus TaxID=549003 RepID=A0A1G8KNT4_9BACI|nr:flagellar biosynthesis anti-sigma factor FlgM [Natribacillus halophilus]SDI45094.1 anti-sigma-28 factor, FlgM family [Natribacillus halophilus]